MKMHILTAVGVLAFGLLARAGDNPSPPVTPNPIITTVPQTQGLGIQYTTPRGTVVTPNVNPVNGITSVQVTVPFGSNGKK